MVHHTAARKNRWKLLRDLTALEKEIGRKLNADELMQSFVRWYSASLPHFDPKKSRDDYCAAFFAELNKIRVPTGEGEALNRRLPAFPCFRPLSFQSYRAWWTRREAGGRWQHFIAN